MNDTDFCFIAMLLCSIKARHAKKDGDKWLSVGWRIITIFWAVLLCVSLFTRRQ